MRHRGFLILSTAILSLSVTCSDMLGKYDDGITPSGGFTINDGAAKTVLRAVTLSMDVQNATEMRFSNDGGVWSDWEAYTATKSWDLALGPQLQTVRGEFKSKEGKILSATDSIDPFMEEKLVASDGHANDQMGGTISLSSYQTGISMSNNGSSIIVSCPLDTISGNYGQGSAYLYQWNGAIWTEKKFTADNGLAGDLYTWSVAISGNGKRIAIGARMDDVTYTNQGSVYVYTFNGSSWEKNFIAASDGKENDEYGVAVSLSSDGNTFVVGSYRSDRTTNLGEDYGAAYIYNWTGASWNEVKLTASNGMISDLFGWHVAVSADAQTVVVGALMGDGLVANSGAVYVYRLNGSSWIETILKASDGASSDFFGRFVTISGDGNVIAVGAPQDDGTYTNQGSVYIFRWDGSQWNEKRLTASDAAAEDWFGYSVSLSGDGTKLLVGSRLDDATFTNQGSAYLYTWDGTNWNEDILRASDGAAEDHFGYSVSISGDGGTYGITAPGKNVGSNADQGGFYLY